MSCSACLDKAVAIMSQSRENIFVFVSISYLFWDDQKHTSYEVKLLTGATLPTQNATNKNINLKTPKLKKKAKLKIFRFKIYFLKAAHFKVNFQRVVERCSSNKHSEVSIYASLFPFDTRTLAVRFCL